MQEAKTHKQIILEDCRPLGQTEFEYLYTSLCGYVRDKVTFKDSEVTCFYCKKLLTYSK